MALVNIGVVGLGAAGRAFVPAILKHPGFRLAAGAEPVEATRAEMLTRHDASGYASVAAMLEHPGLDAVYIATPTDLHPGHVLLALAPCCLALEH